MSVSTLRHFGCVCCLHFLDLQRELESSAAPPARVKILNVKYSYRFYPEKCSRNYFLFTEARDSPRIPTFTFSHRRTQLLPDTRRHKTPLHGLLNIPAACRCKVWSEMEANGFKTALKSKRVHNVAITNHTGRHVKK